MFLISILLLFSFILQLLRSVVFILNYLQCACEFFLNNIVITNYLSIKGKYNIPILKCMVYEVSLLGHWYDEL